MVPSSGASGLTLRQTWPVIVLWPLIRRLRLGDTANGASPTKALQRKTELALENGIIAGSIGHAGLSEATRHTQAAEADRGRHPGFSRHQGRPAAELGRYSPRPFPVSERIPPASHACPP